MIVSDPVPSAPGDTPRRGRCPTCGHAKLRNGNAQRPFCSLTCRLIDLGVWLDERYVVPGEQTDDVR
jgi:endogenous inhibitor of DNA gyrase (YacG/DUF329 family)